MEARQGSLPQSRQMAMPATAGRMPGRSVRGRPHLRAGQRPEPPAFEGRVQELPRQANRTARQRRQGQPSRPRRTRPGLVIPHHLGLAMITVVTGPPCAGKTTHVHQHALPGDVVIDFDAIARALGSTEDHDHDPHLREITAAAWAAAVKRTLDYARHRVWIIDSRPLPARRQDYDQAGARYVHLTADSAELHRRVEADGRSSAWHSHIDRFLAADDRDPQPTSRLRWVSE